MTATSGTGRGRTIAALPPHARHDDTINPNGRRMGSASSGGLYRTLPMSTNETLTSDDTTFAKRFLAGKQRCELRDLHSGDTFWDVDTEAGEITQYEAVGEPWEYAGYYRIEAIDHETGIQVQVFPAEEISPRLRSTYCRRAV